MFSSLNSTRNDFLFELVDIYGIYKDWLVRYFFITYLELSYHILFYILVETLCLSATRSIPSYFFA